MTSCQNPSGPYEIHAGVLAALRFGTEQAQAAYDAARYAFADASARTAAKAIVHVWPNAATIVLDFSTDSDGCTAAEIVLVRDADGELLWFAEFAAHDHPDVIAWIAANDGEPEAIDTAADVFITGCIGRANDAVQDYFPVSDDAAAGDRSGAYAYEIEDALGQ